jgi:WD40 repeat protein
MGIAAMSPDDPSPLEEELVAWLAASDEALAQGQTPATPLEAQLTPELRTQLERGLAGLKLVQQLRPRRSSTGAASSTLPHAGADSASSSTLPWSHLGRFQIRRELGRGGFGTVFLAYDPILEREVALKVAHAEVVTTPELRDRFHREARAASGLSHANLVPIHEAGDVGPVCFIVSEYCPGPTLAQWLKGCSEPVPFHDSAQLVATLADAVHHAHSRGVLHRDLKPANILLQKSEVPNPESESGEPTLSDSGLRISVFSPKITDFGLAKNLHEGGLEYPTRSGAVVGTASYMAPEQASGKSKAIGTGADVYGLGAILYELLTGRPPFKGESELDTLQQVQLEEAVTPARLRLKTPRDLETICLKCLQKEPARRYASALELAEDLRRYLRGESILARPTSVAERVWRWCRRKPALATASGLAVLVLLAAAGSAISYSFALQQSRAAGRLRNEQKQTQDALHEAEVQRSLAQQLSTRLAMERGLFLCEQGEAARGMLWLAHGLEIVPPGAADLEREIRMNLSGWQHQMHYLRAMLTHSLPIRTVAVSPDGKLIATGSHDGTAQVWDKRTGARQGPPLRHDGEVNCVAFSPDGTLLATGSHDGTARIWDIRSGTNTLPPLKHHGDVWTVAFSPDGVLLATASFDRTACLWEVRTGNRHGGPIEFKGHAVMWVSFSPDGKTLLATTVSGISQLVDVATGQPRTRSIMHSGRKAAISPDSRIVATGGEGLAPHFWDAATGDPIGRAGWEPGRVRAVVFAPDGRTVAANGGPNTVRLWETGTNKQRGAPLHHASDIFALAFSPDGQMLITGTDDGTARVWDPNSTQPIGMPIRLDDRVEAVAWSPDSRSVVIGGDGGRAEIWDIGAGRPPARVLPHRSEVRAVAFSRDGKTVLTGSQDGTGRLWDTVTGEPASGPLGHEGAVWAVAISPDGQTLLTGSVDKTARLWEGRSGRLLRTLTGHEQAIHSVAFSPNGNLVVTACYDGTARLWNAMTGQQIGPPLHHGKEVNVAEFSPDGRMVVTGSEDKTARLWSVASGRQLGSNLVHESAINDVAFSPEGRLVLTGSDDKTARIWDVASGQAVGEPLRHRSSVNAVAFSPDGSAILTASADWTARLWDVTTGQPRGSALAHQGPVLAAAFSPDGHAVVTGSSDGTARLWDAASGQALGPAMRHQGPVLAVRFSPDGQTILTGSGDYAARLWPRQRALTGTIEQIVLWIEVATGMELDADGDVHLLESAEWQKRRQRLAELGGPPRNRTSAVQANALIGRRFWPR